MVKLKNIAYILGISILPLIGYAQTGNPAPANWYNLSLADQGVLGINTEKAYEFLKHKKPKKVVVAVIDSGVDPLHEDLKDVMWRNPKEIPNNLIDDDGNGYIDDVYGWNFLGNAAGENIEHDNLELTRLIRIYEPKYISVLPSTSLSEDERREFVAYQKMIGDYTSKLDEAQFGQVTYSRISNNVDSVIKRIGKQPEEISKADLDGYEAANEEEKMVLKIIKQEISKTSFVKIYNDLKDAAKYYSDQVTFHLNKEYDPRPLIGDDYQNSNERHYGNNDVKGPDAEHGTHVAGIIAARRENGIGINGVSNSAEIMSVRVVPNGDERDKDVANGIRYAVDNGATIINMSFGKGYSYDNKTVDAAIKYAEEKDVLLIHAAGNDSKNIDIEKNYPNKYYTDSVDALLGEASNWITVGATGPKIGDELLAEFSNYGYKTVDVFAPGVKINSTLPDGKYKELDGTSMAAPVVAGLAALLRAYYPDLSAPTVKEIIIKTVSKVDKKVKIKSEGSTKKVFLDEISVGGGVVNAYQAVLLAEEYQKLKK